jgi:hypothetical protein
MCPRPRGEQPEQHLVEELAHHPRSGAQHSPADEAVALYERLGGALLDTVEQRWGPEQTVTVRCYAAGS